MDENQTLALRDNAKQQLMQIKTVESGMEYLNKVKAIEVWVRAEKKDAELQNIVAEQKIRTQRILGGLIKDGQDRKEIATQKDSLKQNSVMPASNNGRKKLSDIGITAKESSTFKAIAEIPDEIFEKEIIQKKEAVKKAVSELTTAGMLKLSREFNKKGNSKIIPLPIGEFNVIYADPAWEYRNSGISGAANNHYSTMPTSEICNLKIPSSKNSVLFLWVTNPLLQDAFQVLQSWEFEYKTNMVWIKEKAGQGFYVKGQHELLLICTKGSFTPDNSIYVRSVVESNRQEHSRKPEIFYEIIEKLYPEGKYLELFARKKRNKWTCWGNEL